MLALNGLKRAQGPNVFNLLSFISQSCQFGAQLKTVFQWHNEHYFSSNLEATLVLLSIFKIGIGKKWKKKKRLKKIYMAKKNYRNSIVTEAP